MVRVLHNRSIGLHVKNARRLVPIPSVLVRILREHIDQFGTVLKGRPCQLLNGGVKGASYNCVWDEVRTYALRPAEVASTLADWPHDPRHVAVSLWLNGGVSAY